MNELTEKIDNYLNAINEAKDKWAEFEKMLQNHDWFYSMSSDYRSYQKGKKEWEDIRKMKEELEKEDKDKARYIYYKYIDDKTGLSSYYKPEYKKLKKKFE